MRSCTVGGRTCRVRADPKQHHPLTISVNQRCWDQNLGLNMTKRLFMFPPLCRKRIFVMRQRILSNNEIVCADPRLQKLQKSCSQMRLPFFFDLKSDRTHGSNGCEKRVQTFPTWQFRWFCSNNNCSCVRYLFFNTRSQFHRIGCLFSRSIRMNSC